MSKTRATMIVLFLVGLTIVLASTIPACDGHRLAYPSVSAAIGVISFLAGWRVVRPRRRVTRYRSPSFKEVIFADDVTDEARTEFLRQHPKLKDATAGRESR